MKRVFLAPLAVLAAALSSGEAVAMPVAAQPSTSSTDALAGQGDRVSISHNGDIFKFVLKRNAETGQLFSDHESHYSHGSHGSHRSHMSGY